MMTKLLPVTAESLNEAAKLLRNGEVVAFPTETVYGLGASCFSIEGIKKIYQAKGRPSDNPLIVHVAPGFDLTQIALTVPDTARRLMDAFWPGPLTIILPKNEQIPDEVTGGLKTVAIREPSHPAAMALIKTAGIPVVAPSANTSGRPSPTTASHVYEDMAGKIPLILDGGSCEVGLESTIIDLSEDVPTVLRPGGITLEMLRTVLPETIIDPAVKATKEVAMDVVPKAPGMKYRHYAPKGELILTDHGPEAVAEWIREDLEKDPSKVIGVIATEEFGKALLAQGIRVPFISLGPKKDLTVAAHRLFEALREADERGWARFYGEAFAAEGIGEAIMNRFLKASSEKRL